MILIEEEIVNEMERMIEELKAKPQRPQKRLKINPNIKESIKTFNEEMIYIPTDIALKRNIEAISLIKSNKESAELLLESWSEYQHPVLLNNLKLVGHKKVNDLAENFLENENNEMVAEEEKNLFIQTLDLVNYNVVNQRHLLSPIYLPIDIKTDGSAPQRLGYYFAYDIFEQSASKERKIILAVPILVIEEFSLLFLQKIINESLLIDANFYPNDLDFAFVEEKKLNNTNLRDLQISAFCLLRVKKEYRELLIDQYRIFLLNSLFFKPDISRQSDTSRELLEEELWEIDQKAERYGFLCAILHQIRIQKPMLNLDSSIVKQGVLNYKSYIDKDIVKKEVTIEQIKLKSEKIIKKIRGDYKKDLEDNFKLIIFSLRTNPNAVDLYLRRSLEVSCKNLCQIKVYNKEESIYHMKESLFEMIDTLSLGNTNLNKRLHNLRRKFNERVHYSSQKITVRKEFTESEIKDVEETLHVIDELNKYSLSH